MDEKPLSKRSLARDCLFKALYAMQISDENLNDSLLDTLREYHEKAVDQAYAKDLARDYSQEKEAIHALLDPFIILQGKANVTDIELAILRLAATEFLYKPDT
ncbi:MAG: transcription antitermination factor NusB, partial [Pseudomonadota bacterium]|nr:transcription antitermination factor NusB [Pseudomonadota bacterium]